MKKYFFKNVTENKSLFLKEKISYNIKLLSFLILKVTYSVYFFLIRNIVSVI